MVDILLRSVCSRTLLWPKRKSTKVKKVIIMPRLFGTFLNVVSLLFVITTLGHVKNNCWWKCINFTSPLGCDFSGSVWSACVQNQGGVVFVCASVRECAFAYLWVLPLFFSFFFFFNVAHPAVPVGVLPFAMAGPSEWVGWGTEGLNCEGIRKKFGLPHTQGAMEAVSEKVSSGAEKCPNAQLWRLETECSS